MKNLLTWEYWFTLRPEALNQLANRLFLAALIILFVSCFIFGWLKKKSSLYRGLVKKLYNFAVGNTVIGLLLFFFNYESAIFFSARFWLLLWLILIISWLVIILKDLKKIPAKKKQISAEQTFKKYLP